MDKGSKSEEEMEKIYSETPNVITHLMRKNKKEKKKHINIIDIVI